MGDTPLIYAVRSGKAQFVEKILSAGADANITNKYGTTALMYASNNGHVECLRELIAARG